MPKVTIQISIPEEHVAAVNAAFQSRFKRKEGESPRAHIKREIMKFLRSQVQAHKWEERERTNRAAVIEEMKAFSLEEEEEITKK